jgi:hypothetical protein
MDPNANLRRQEYILDILFMTVTGRKDNRAELAELRAALRDWLKSGGFQPDWADCPLAAKWFARFITFR